MSIQSKFWFSLSPFSYPAMACLATVLIVWGMACGKPKKGTSTSASKTSDLPSVVALLGLSNPLAKKATSSNGYSSTDLKALDDYRAAIGEILKKTNASDCFSGVTFNFIKSSPTCFAPALAMSGTHPNNLSTYTNQSINDCPEGASCIPPGEIGIYTASESTGEACSSAQINTITGELAQPINNALRIMAGIACVGQTLKKDLPTFTDGVDLTADVSAVFTLGRVDNARIYREGDYTSLAQPIYRTVFEADIQGMITNWIIRHSPSGNGKDFRGRIYGYQTQSNSAISSWSMTYEQTGSNLLIEVKSGITPIYFGTKDLFEPSGEYSPTVFNNYIGAEKGRYLLSLADKDTGLGEIKLAFQNDGQEKKARVFHAKSISGGPDTGFAYFGYGPSFSSGNLTTLGGMCCNTSGPSSTCLSTESSYDLSSKAQSQTLSRSTTTGLFTAASSGINFAPTTSCNYSPTSSGGTDATGFKWASIAAWGTSGTDITSAALTNDLGSLTSLGTMSTLIRPDFNPK